MLVSLPSLGWSGGSVWSLLLCFALPAALLYCVCLLLLWRCRCRLRLLSVHCLPGSHDWSDSWLLARWLAVAALYAPFVLLPVAVLAVCFVLLAALPALFASCLIALLLLCAAAGALLCYCEARRWQSDALTTRSLRAVYALSACVALSVPPLRLGSSFVGWSCLFVSCNAILVLRLVYKVRPNLSEQSAAAPVPAGRCYARHRAAAAAATGGEGDEWQCNRSRLVPCHAPHRSSQHSTPSTDVCFCCCAFACDCSVWRGLCCV